MKIQMKLKDIVRNDNLIEQLGINPYCIAEGSDPETYIEVEIENIIIKENE